MAVTATRKEHFIGLEWLRFALGLYIVVFHTLHNYRIEGQDSWLQDLAGVGFFATSSFFVLSGFLLAHVYCWRGQLREPALSFWSRRFANLYPLHLFSLALTITVIGVISYLGIPPDDTKASLRFVVYDTNEDLGGASREVLEHWMSNAELAFNALLQLLMLHAWNPYYLTFNPPLWSVSTLFFFYLCFPFVAPRLVQVRHPLRWLGLLILLYLLPPLWMIANQAYGMPFTGMLHRMPLLRLPEFLAGIVLYGLFRQQRDAAAQPLIAQPLLLGAFALVCFLAAAWLVKGAQFWYYLLHNGLLLPAQLALIYACAQFGEPSRAGLEQWAKRLGTASLPLFILHVPAFTLFSRGEKLLASLWRGCDSGWSACIAQAGEYSLSPWLYPLFLLLTIALCLWAQRHAVVPMRTWLLARLPVQRKQPSAA